MEMPYSFLKGRRYARTAQFNAAFAGARNPSIIIVLLFELPAHQKRRRCPIGRCFGGRGN